jgi:hypothetical protein
MPIALLFAMQLAAALPTITVERKAEGYLAKVARFDWRQQSSVDAEIARRAADLCGKKQVHWGKFRSFVRLGKTPAAGPAPVSGYFKEFDCVAPDTMSYPRAPTNWQPSQSDIADAKAFLETYYKRRDSGDFGAALGMFAPNVVSDKANWATHVAAQNKQIGTGRRRVTGVTWYVNPDTAPHPGVYVAIDFVGEFPNTYFYCGYLALYRRGEGSYEITREEQNMFTHGQGTPDPANVAQMKAAMCSQ